MPGDPRTSRLAGSAADPASDAVDSRAPALISLLAGTARLIDLLPHLHQHALDVTGGDCSLLFEHNPRDGELQATSGFGLEELKTDPWLPVEEEHVLVEGAFDRHAPTLIGDLARRMPQLGERLGVRTALLVPVANGTQRVGLLAIGFKGAPSPTAANDAAEIADATLMALELFRLRQKDELHRDVRVLLDEFTASLSTTLSLSTGLDIFCHGANRLFAADRTSVWVHDRRARSLVLRASSDSEHLAHGVRVNAKGEKADSFSGYCQPASFDVTAALKEGDNQISLFCTREGLNELGTGGLLSPVVLYRDKD